MSLQEPLNPPVEVVRYSIPADSSLVGHLRDCFTAILAGGGLVEPELIQWQLVFSELVFNAIDHGAKGDPSRTVTVEWSLTQDAVILAAQDPGKGPPDALLNSPSLPADPPPCPAADCTSSPPLRMNSTRGAGRTGSVWKS